MVQRAECQVQVAKYLGSMLTGVTFYYCILLFSRGKACDANIANFG